MKVLESRKAAKIIAQLAGRGAVNLAKAEPVARKIIAEVRRKGDAALRKYGEQWDGLHKYQPLAASVDEMQAALQGISPKLREALQQAAENIRRFCEWQSPAEWSKQQQPGVTVGQIIRPLDSVGCYVPGGRHPLPSTMLMTVIPAQVAGVKRIAVVSPKPAPETLATAALLGIGEFYRIGGAQAVAALAYGTRTVRPVAKIVGPGNSFVTAAKKLVSFDCSIDMLAGPTEVAIVSDNGDPGFIASDLVAQSEHDPETLAVFITSNAKLAKAVANEAKRQAKENAIAKRSLAQNAVALVTDSKEESFAIANAIAPEHISIDSAEDLVHITAAGSVFVGPWSAQSVGDYASGPNHTLPTGAAARFRGGLSILDYVKHITVQELSREGLEQIAGCVTTLAAAEGLNAHAQAVTIRLNSQLR
ncbi:MAG TPA: histidinol dehydrogenase [Terriglobales bacterium]